MYLRHTHGLHHTAHNVTAAVFRDTIKGKFPVLKTPRTVAACIVSFIPNTWPHSEGFANILAKHIFPNYISIILRMNEKGLQKVTTQ
jgi:hypothetical protein